MGGNVEGREWAGSSPEMYTLLQPPEELDLANGLDAALQGGGRPPSRGA